jgi:hypothetical protein
VSAKVDSNGSRTTASSASASNYNSGDLSSYQNGAGPDINQAKLDYFNRKMAENANRPE